MDTRAADSTDKHLDPQRAPKPKRPHEDDETYLQEKEIHIEERERGLNSPSSAGSPIDGATMGGSTMVPETPCSEGKPCIHEEHTGRPCLYSYPSDIKEKSMVDVVPIPPPEPKPRKICGLRRRHFWTLFAVLLGMIVAAAIIGGAIAGTRKNGSSPTPAPTTQSGLPAAASPTPSVAPTINDSLL